MASSHPNPAPARPISPLSEWILWHPPALHRNVESRPDHPLAPTRSLQMDEVHVWAASLDMAPATLVALSESLCPAERARAESFRFELHRDRFMAGRGLLRNILSSYLGVNPNVLNFCYGPAGKPSLANAVAGRSLHFNQAHSEDLLLLAVTRIGAVGVDVERTRIPDDAEDLVSQFFSKRESAAFRNLPAEAKPTAFFNLWTRKEAWLKATGQGIAHSLALVEVSFIPGDAARLVQLPPNLGDANLWLLQELLPAPGFAGALALKAKEASVRCFRWHPDDDPGRLPAEGVQA